MDKLIAAKEAVQADKEAALKAQAKAEATAEALKRQAGGLNAEYDRVCEVGCRACNKEDADACWG